MKAIADNANLVGYAVADKIVGKAAAMLLVKLGVSAVLRRGGKHRRRGVFARARRGSELRKFGAVHCQPRQNGLLPDGTSRQ